jgi:hypothetical protein
MVPLSRVERLWGPALVVGLLLRLCAVFGTPVFPTVANTWDSNFYHETASSLADGEGYTFQGLPTAYYPPGFPFVLSLGYRVAGAHPRIGQLLNVIVSFWLLGATALLVGRFVGRRGAFWTAIFLALEPSQIVMPAFLMSEVLCAAALVTSLACAASFLLGGNAAWVFLGGAAAVLAGLTRGHAFLIVPAAILALGTIPGVGTRRRVLMALLVVIALSSLSVGLWSDRNANLLGKRVPIATNTGLNLLLGNNPNARGGRADPPGGVPQTGDEVRDEEIATARALEYIKEHPGRFVALLPVKAIRLLGPAPATTYRAEMREKWNGVWALLVVLTSQLAHLAAVAMALVFVRGSLFVRGSSSVAKSVRGGFPASALARLACAAVVIWTLGHLPFLGGARYFFPVQPLVWALAAAWIARPRASDSAT